MLVSLAIRELKESVLKFLIVKIILTGMVKIVSVKLDIKKTIILILAKKYRTIFHLVLIIATSTVLSVSAMKDFSNMSLESVLHALLICLGMEKNAHIINNVGKDINGVMKVIAVSQ